MIVPMKKIAVIVQAKDSDQTLWVLRSLGVLHIEHQNPPKGRDISALQDDVSLIEKALNILAVEDSSARNAREDIKDLSQWRVIAKHIAALRSRFDQLQEYSNNMRKRISQWEDWGDFNPAEIEQLAGRNIYVRLYQIPVKEVNSFPASVIVKVVSKRGAIADCVAISREKVELPFKEIALPKMGLGEMRRRLDDDTKMLGALKMHLRRHACYYDDFERVKGFIEKEVEFSEALGGMAQADEIAYIVGYAPLDEVDGIIRAARQNRWGVFASDPSEEDRVPTLIRNPKWVSMVKSVFKLIEIVPGYRELDISLWFLVFLSIFYGMLIGDAGYGLVFFALTVFAQKKWGKRLRDKSIFTLFYLLNLCAIIWGVLTGTFFGCEWLSQTVKPLMPALKNDRNVQALCFFLGAFHLSIAHVWRAVLKMPALRALADIGWTIILWGGYLLARTLILGYGFPGFGKWFFITGCILVVLFTDPRRNVLKGVGSGLGALLLNIVNSFTDIVSYIRLFAVGLAGVAIADAFNAMAMSIGFSSIISSLITALVLLTGHTLNLLLGPLAVLVHGVRLNVLEFCSHVDIKWSGFPYKPLKEETIK